jgi:2-dehydropantoate 2-reductase
MRILVVGAGAIGGYFGGRLLEKGEDVTFLVRRNRKQQLEKDGLVIESVNGNIELQAKTIESGDEAGHFDVILVSTKAYHLPEAIESFRQYVGEKTMILPLLNGIIHIEKLVSEFSSEQVLGGLCFIESTLDHEGKVLQTSTAHDLVFGERNGEITERIQELEKVFSDTKAGFRLSQRITEDMWHKYMFITGLSGITTLMRAPMGPIRENPSGFETTIKMFNEIIAVMTSIDAPITENVEYQLKKIARLGYLMKSSMQRDMEKGLPIEADHLQGYLIEIAKKGDLQIPVLEAVYANLKIYEQQLSKTIN